jgi:hydrogenase maturation protease
MSSIDSSGSRPRVLLYGYGNPGRQDDGAGVLLVDELERWAASSGRTDLAFERNYQLNVEDAWTAARHDIVVFVDASGAHEDGFRFRPLEPALHVAFSTHAMDPESVLALSRDLYGVQPSAWLLTVRGYSWEPNGAMTTDALRNLEAAKADLIAMLEAPENLLHALGPKER